MLDTVVNFPFVFNALCTGKLLVKRLSRTEQRCVVFKDWFLWNDTYCIIGSGAIYVNSACLRHSVRCTRFDDSFPKQIAMKSQNWTDIGLILATSLHGALWVCGWHSKQIVNKRINCFESKQRKHGNSGFCFQGCDAMWRHRNYSTGNGLLPDYTKPLPEPMLTYNQYNQYGPVALSWRQF